MSQPTNSLARCERTPWKCPKCEDRRGVAVRSAIMPVCLDAHEDHQGTIIVGRMTWVCATCWQAGETVIAGNGETSYLGQTES